MLNTVVYSLIYTKELPHSVLTEISQSTSMISGHYEKISTQATEKINMGIFGLGQLVCVLCELSSMFEDSYLDVIHRRLFDQISLWTKVLAGLL